MGEIETVNDHLVGITSAGMVRIAVLPLSLMPSEEALRMAAWIVTLVGDDERFAQILAAVRST